MAVGGIEDDGRLIANKNLLELQAFMTSMGSRNYVAVR